MRRSCAGFFPERILNAAATTPEWEDKVPTLYSWNVNGVRAIGRAGFLDWLAREQPDIVCLQETKAHPDSLPPALRAPKGYSSLWQWAHRKGYSGVSAYFKPKWEPQSIRVMGVPEFDNEGRVQVLEYKDFTLINAYYPNAQPERARLAYKLAFCDAMLRLCNRLRRSGRHVVVCGDYNIAHTEIDLARPKENRDNPGFYPEECERMDRFIRAGYVDTFRRFTPGPGHYTWWSYRSKARERNIGWRIDYFCVDAAFIPRVKASRIHPEVMGADHCPISVTIQ
jgi:exodeoxyribonuclease-3